MNRSLAPVFILGLILSFSSCNNSNSSNTRSVEADVPRIFNPLSPEESGITFTNTLQEDSVINYFSYPYIYMGGGVAVGDVNNDGLQDLYFTGNMVENKLYLNRGGLQFEDISGQAGVQADERWVTGATMADVNADGWMDIYLSVSGKFATTKNLLYLNNGPGENGIPTFTESAEKCGVADEGASTQATFFDYDKDGDLDLYVANYPFTSFKTRNFTYQFLMNSRPPEKSDRLYRNKGDGTFEDVTEQAGLLSFGLTLSATVGDFNEDGWEDLYISNDFAPSDYFFFNNGDGTFSEKIRETTQHTAFFGMGADVADFNNDGLLDIMQVDMTPEDNRRAKANMATMNAASFWEIVNMGMHHQYMQNVLQLNNGVAADGLPHFSDIARLAGVSSTDWSWAPLFADLDNDGWKDIFVTNGTRRDINNKDYFENIEKAPYQVKKDLNKLELTRNMPAEKTDNYAFRNNGDLTFSPVVKSWGLSFEGWSNGAAYADLDNDGDLDMVINNIDDASLVFQNTSSEQQLANFLRVSLKGSPKNPMGLGAKVVLRHKAGLQYQHLTLSRGFQSSVEPFIHFGLGQEPSVEELTVIWPDGKQQVFRDIPANQLLEVDYKKASEPSASPSATGPDEVLFQEATRELGLNHKHTENPYDDFQHELLLPHAYSRNGPGLAVGDVNGDGLEDIFIGGATGSIGALYLQHTDGTLQKAAPGPWEKDPDKEDLSALFFDADGDGGLDLYVVSGSNEVEEGSPRLQDRLYLNDARGNFEKTEGALPDMRTSGSCVKAGDFDNDGDLDLFVGGRIVPRAYPLPARSYILRNDSEGKGRVKFTDVTEELAPTLLEAGLVTDATWTDFNQDDRPDLVITGEWMPITVLENTGKGFVDKTGDYGMAQSTGWWYSIAAGDFDQDGDTDFVGGNLGLNYRYQASPEEPFDVYANDFDKNGQLDIVLAYYHKGVQYPVKGREYSSAQIPAIGIKFPDYNSFAAATLEDIYTREDLDAGLHYQARTFASAYIENKGNGKFEARKLPNAAQVSSINGIVAEDFNQDGHLDLVLAGNLFASEVETPRNDASYGHFLAGDGKGNFRAVPFSESGLFLGQDTKGLALIRAGQGIIILAANNDDQLKAIRVLSPGEGELSSRLEK